MQRIRRLAYLFREKARSAALAEEMKAHEAMKREAFEAAGMSPTDARFAARAAMGNVTYMSEEARATWIAPWLDSLRQDAAYGLRNLRRHPSFGIVAVVVLASAIGLNASVFTVFRSLVSRPWPVPEASRLAYAYASECCERAGGQAHGFSLAEIDYLVRRSGFIDAVALSRQTGDTVASGRASEPTGVKVAWVNDGYFDALGERPVVGRLFVGQGSSAPAAVISNSLWMSRFGGDRSVVGKTLSVNGTPVPIAGVAPEGFVGIAAAKADAWLPIASASLLNPGDRWATRVAAHPENCCTRLAVRLRRGVAVTTARRELTALHRQFVAENSKEAAVTKQDAASAQIELSPLTVVASDYGGERAIAPLFRLMFGCAAAVLLLACANVGNLLLARAAARTREVAIRVSVGATRARVVRQFLTESMILSLIAATGGLLIAFFLPGRLVPLLGTGFETAETSPDRLVLIFSLAAAVCACLAFGLAPALHGTRSLRRAAGGTAMRTWFLSAQVAISTILLVAAALLLRGVQRAAGASLGFKVDEISVTSFDVSATLGGNQPLSADVAASIQTAYDALGNRYPVALTRYTPLKSVGKGSVTFADNSVRDVLVEEVSPRYFDVLGIPLRAGRTVSSSDDRVVVINESLARDLGGPQAALGRVIRVGANEASVVGVAANAKTTFTADSPEPTVYRRLAPTTAASIVAPSGSPAAAQIVAAAQRAAPQVRITVRSLSEFLDARMASSRLLARLTGGVAVVSLLLACLGLFGVCAYWVEQRTREIGLRIALGASTSSVIRLITGMGGRAMFAGLLLGLVGALGVARLLRGFIFGVSTADPVAFGIVSALMLLAGFTSTYLPAMRAARVQPTIALRHD
jgi:putative ABC transport system permease protein